MSGSYVMSVGNNFSPEPTEPIMESLFQQYERVLVESLITSFGLNFLIVDRHGGDVDTIHNVRQIGIDPQMEKGYKNENNRAAYEGRGEYDSAKYHSASGYIDRNKKLKEQKQSGMLVDAYTGKRIAPNEKSDLDHVIPAKEIHDDRGRVLAGLSGEALANSPENLQATTPKINRSKKADSMTVFFAKKQPIEDVEANQDNMRRIDATVRDAYEAKLARAYYTSPAFAKDMASAAAKVGITMGAKRALGFIFAEMWFAAKEEFQRIQEQSRFDLGECLTALGCGLKRGFERAKEKYADLFSRFFSGTAAGVLASLTTTLCNIFFTTAKRTVRIIRESYASLVEAGKVLFINPDNYTFGERMRAVAKILATGSSIVAGVLVSEAIGKLGIDAISVAGDIIQTFCGALVTGILSCTLLYFLDRNELMNRLFHVLDKLPTIETEINYYRQQADYFERYAAELMDVDMEQFKKEIVFIMILPQLLQLCILKKN